MSTDFRDKARDTLTQLLLTALAAPSSDNEVEAKRVATWFLRWQLEDGWRPPLAPVRDWRDTRRLTPERVAEHANTARAALGHPNNPKDGE